jgi:hypothetical protein
VRGNVHREADLVFGELFDLCSHQGLAIEPDLYLLGTWT